MITLYGMPRSRSLRVSWLLEELGLDWQYHYVDFAKGYNRSPDFLAINPGGKVPALTDGNICLTESAAICHYLAEKYGEGAWLPKPATAASACYHRWYSFIITELEQPLWSIGKHKFALPKEHRIGEMLQTAGWEFEKAARLAEQMLPDSSYLTGETPTVVDILLAHTLNWAVGFSLPLPEKLEAYRQRLSARPAMKAGLAKETSAADKGD